MGASSPDEGKAEMKRSELQEYLRNGRARVAGETFAVAKTRRVSAGAFAVIRDSRETTCIIEESKLRPKNCLGVEGDWRLITFDMILPFGLVGFIAQVSGALAAEGISLMALSSYSTDHVLVKNKDLERAAAALERLGLRIDRA
jgi:hypothetical protein